MSQCLTENGNSEVNNSEFFIHSQLPHDGLFILHHLNPIAVRVGDVEICRHQTDEDWERPHRIVYPERVEERFWAEACYNTRNSGIQNFWRNYDNTSNSR